MALSDKDIVITPNRGASDDPKIEFKGANTSVASQTITARVYPTSNGTLSFEGTAGQLFSITNSLTGTIYSVNDVSGIPSIEVLDTGLVKIAQYGGNVLIGTGTDNGTKFRVSGNAHITQLGIGSSNNPSYDFYNNGTSYFNGGVTVDDTLAFSGGNQLNFYTASGNLRGYINASETDDNHLQIAASGGEDIVFKDGGLAGTRNLVIRGGNVGTEAYGSMRSPIFYDSNDTNYYLNPNSTSFLDSVSVNVGNENIGAVNGSTAGLILRGNYNSNAWAHKFHKYDVGGGVPLYLSKTVSTGVWTAVQGWGNGLTYDSQVFGSFGADTSVYSPIFYDSSNTGYYIDPASTSQLSSLNTRSLAINPDENTSSATTGTLSIWSNPGSTTSTLMFKRTDQLFGTHGAVSDQYATFWNMDTANRGWIFRYATSTTEGSNVLSIRNNDGTTTIGASGFTPGNVHARLNIHAGSGSATLYRDIDLFGSWASGEGHAITAMYGTDSSSIVGQQVFQHDNPGSRIKWGRLYHSGNQSTYPMHLISDGSSAYLEMNTGSIRAPIFYDYNDTSFYVDPASTLTSLQIAGSVEQGNNYAHPNVEWSAAGTSTGEIIFYLPGTTSNYGMVHMVFDVYEYNGNATSTITLGGHNWNGTWYNVTCDVVGQFPHQVRLGSKDGRYVVVFGESTTSWSYGTIRLRKIHNGGFYNNVMDLGGNWSAVQSTANSFSSITGDLRGLRTPATFTAGNHITSGGYVTGIRLWTGYDSGVTGSVNADSWFRSSGNTGWYNASYGGGIYMEDGTWVRVYNNKQFLSANIIQSNTDVRAPIFYDANDTSYFLDPASNSNLNRLVLQKRNDNYNVGSVNVVNAVADWQSLTNTSGQWTVTQYNETNLYSNSPGSVYTYGAVMSWRTENHSFQLYASHTGDLAYKTQWNNDNYSGWVFPVVYGRTTGAGAIYGTIFYDANDSTYYLDPNSLTSLRTVGSWRSNSSDWDGEFAGKIQYHSNNWYLQASGSWIFRNAGGTNVAEITNAGEYQGASLLLSGMARTNSSRLVLRDDSIENHATDNDSAGIAVNYYGYNSGTTRFRNFTVFDGKGGSRLNVYGSGNYTQATGSLRAPIFYDSDDTNFYADPNSYSRFSSHEIASTLVHGTKKTYYIGNLTADGAQARRFEIARLYVDYNDWHFAGVFQVELHNYYFTGGDYQLWNISYDYNNVSCNLISGDSPRGRYATVTCSSPVQISGDFYYISVYVDVRYYARYYAWVSSSWPAATVHQAQSGYALVYQSPSPSNISDFTPSTTITTTNVIRSTDGFSIPYYNGGNVFFRSATHWENITGIDVIGGAGEFRLSSDTGEINFRTDGSVLATTNVQSPIYYDMNDTNYYVDPRSTSRLSGLRLDGVDNNASGEDAILWINKPNNSDWAVIVSGALEYGVDLRMAASHSYAIRALANGSEYSRLGSDLFYHTSSVRAPIFYDSNDTAYYVDPASTSNLNGINLLNGKWSTVNNADGNSLEIYVKPDNNNTYVWRHIYGGTGTGYGTGVGGYGIYAQHLGGGYSLLFNSAGYVTAPYSLRSPIFYDSVNTSYYVDPASTSNLFGLTVGNTITGSITGTAGGETLATVTGRGASTSTSVTLSSGNNQFNGHFYLLPYDASGNHYPHFNDGGNGTGAIVNWRLFTGGTNSHTHVWTTSYTYFANRVEAAGDMRTPIFYDSNNTGYYWDGASTSKWNESIQDGWHTFNNYGIGITGTYDSYRLQTIFAMGSAYRMASDGADTNNMYGLAWSHPNAGSLGGANNLNDHGLLIINNGSFRAAISSRAVFSADVRGTLFYDYNNTNYYVDPNGTSRLGNTETDQSYTYGWFRNYSNNTGLYNQNTTQHLSSTINGYWDMSSTTTVTGIRFYTGGHISALRGYVYADTSNSIGFLNSGGSWRLRVVSDDYSLADGSSMRAQLFYDSNDTNYYVDPASGSNLYRTSTYIAGKDANSNWVTGFQNTPVSSYNFHGDVSSGGPSGTWWFYESMRHSNSSNYWGTQIAWGWEDNANRLLQRNVSGNSFSSWVEYLNTSGRTFSGDLIMSSSVRAPIFYDSDNTSYYVDPASTSNLVGLTVTNTITGSITGNAGSATQLYITESPDDNVTYNIPYVSPSGIGGGNRNVYIDNGGLTFNPGTNVLSCASFSGSLSGTATTATTANALNINNNYRVNSLGVGTAASGTAGEIRATNNITAYYSDDRLKTKLGNIPNALEKVMSLNGFYYEANETAQSLGYKVKREVGLSAQEVEKVLPETVAPAPIDEKYKTLHYERIIPLLVEAIKEQQAQIEELKAALKRI